MTQQLAHVIVLDRLPKIELNIYGDTYCVLYCQSAERAQRLANDWVASERGRSAVLHLPASTPDRRLRVTIERADKAVPTCSTP